MGSNIYEDNSEFQSLGKVVHSFASSDYVIRVQFSDQSGHYDATNMLDDTKFIGGFIVCSRINNHSVIHRNAVVKYSVSPEIISGKSHFVLNPFGFVEH